MNTSEIDTVNCLGGSLEVIDSFCYVEETISWEYSCFESIVAKLKMAWKRFRKLLPLLTSMVLFSPNEEQIVPHSIFGSYCPYTIALTAFIFHIPNTTFSFLLLETILLTH